MTAPSPAVFQPSVGAVSADNLNTFVQTLLNYAQLRNLTGLTDMQIAVLGASTEADGGQGNFYYNATSTATDDNASVIVPYGTTQGAWLRLPVSLVYASAVGLPTTLPSKPGVIWNNGGVLCVS